MCEKWLIIEKDQYINGENSECGNKDDILIAVLGGGKTVAAAKATAIAAGNPPGPNDPRNNPCVYDFLSRLEFTDIEFSDKAPKVKFKFPENDSEKVYSTSQKVFASEAQKFNTKYAKHKGDNNNYGYKHASARGITDKVTPETKAGVSHMLKH